MIRYIVLATTLMALGGCSLYYKLLPFSVSMENIPWEGPRELTLADCPNIDGLYSVVPIGRKDANIFVLYSEKSIFESYSIDRVIDTLRFSDNYYVGPKISTEENKKRDREILVELSIQGNIATKKLLDKSGQLYSITTVLLDPNIRPDEWRKGREARVGCHEGKYINRNVYSSGGGGEGGSAGSRTWSEYQIEKLPDGSLKIRKFGKELVQGEEPRVVSDYTLTFPAYRP